MEKRLSVWKEMDSSPCHRQAGWAEGAKQSCHQPVGRKGYQSVCLGGHQPWAWRPHPWDLNFLSPFDIPGVPYSPNMILIST